MDRWEGKVAVVTGASSGLGEAIARDLVKHGMKVVALARRKDRLEALKEQCEGPGEIECLQCDLTSENDILAAFKWVDDNWGAVHVLINNAGVLIPTMMQDVSTEALRKMFETNVIGLSACSREALNSMKKHKISEGHIINMNSISGHSIYPFPGLGGYSSTKHSVTALTEFLRLEISLSKLPIRVSSVSPGFAKSEMSDGFVMKFPTPETFPILESSEVSQGVLFCLMAAPNLNISEICLEAVGEFPYPTPEMLQSVP